MNPSTKIVCSENLKNLVDQCWQNICLEHICGSWAFKSFRDKLDFDKLEEVYFILLTKTDIYIREKS